MIFLLASAILATEPTTAGYEVVRAGDRAMACPALISEINGINRQIQDQQVKQAAATNSAASSLMDGANMSAGGVVMSGIASVAGMVPFGGTAMSMARQAQMAAGRMKMMDQIDVIQREAMAMLPVQQRLDHLMELYSDKGC